MEGLKFPTSVPGILLNVQEGQVTKVKDPLSGGAMCGTCSRTSYHRTLLCSSVISYDLRGVKTNAISSIGP